MAKTQNDKIIFGLKIKQLRQQHKLTTDKLSTRSGLSISYLNEIEKGKKFPKQEKIIALATALEISAEELTSGELSGSLAPVGDLLKSNFLNELPLELFGIELGKVVEIIANAPARVGAFISTLVELSRNYAMREVNFYHGAIRSYQELHYNYFKEIEEAVLKFNSLYDINAAGSLESTQLKRVLKSRFKYKIADNGLDRYPDLSDLRSIFLPRQRKLLLNGQLSSTQLTFQLAKELGFQFLELKERSKASSVLRVNSFEQVLNHFKASYFAAALLINRTHFVEDLRTFFQRSRWDGEAFLDLMRKYNASPELLFQRLTNIGPEFFDLKQLFFLRFKHHPVRNSFQIDKELHLNRHHHPHGNQLNEHYCRRWMSLSLLSDLNQMQKEGKYTGTIVGAQRSNYFGTEDEYLCLTLARPGLADQEENVSVTIGFLINDNLKDTIQFWNDPNIRKREVHTTCERCPIEDCSERAVPAYAIERRKKRRKIEKIIRELGE